jgi:hypothetical protein
VEIRLPQLIGHGAKLAFTTKPKTAPENALVSLPGDQQRRLSLRFDAGISGYAFTFG